MFIHSKSFQSVIYQYNEFSCISTFGVAFPDILWLWFHQAGKWLRRGHVAWPSLGTPRPYRGPGSCLALHSGEIVEFLRYSNDTMILYILWWENNRDRMRWYEMCVGHTSQITIEFIESRQLIGQGHGGYGGDASAGLCALLQLLAEWCHDCPTAAEAGGCDILV